MVCWGSDGKYQKTKVGRGGADSVRHISKKEVIVPEMIFTCIYRLIQMPCTGCRLIIIVSVRPLITSSAPAFK